MNALRKLNIPAGIGCLLLLTACGPYSKKDLMGSWQATLVLEEGDSLTIDPAEVQFEFTSAAAYTFQSTLNYQEAGTFSIDGRLLYTVDTLNNASTEKAVEITLLTKDSLFLRMMSEGKERVIKLKRLE